MLGWIEREVRQCRPIAMRYFTARSLRVARKPDASPVTAADRAVEERLRRAIARACPGEPILGEEFGATGRVGSTYWTVDPIDGTRAFSRRLPTWSILIGRVERGVPVLGFCDFPALGITMAVAPGVRAFERTGTQRRHFPAPRRVALGDAVVFHGGSHWWAGTGYARGFTRLMRATYLERSYGDCYGYVWALRGCVDLVLDCRVKPWDMVPLAALARATGRVLTDFSGRPCHTGPQAVFGSPTLARAACKILRQPYGKSVQ